MTRKSEAQKADEAKTQIIDLEIGKRLSRFRRIARLTQEEMAAALDVPLRLWRGYEDGERMPAARLYMVCQILRLEPNKVFDGLPLPSVGEKADRRGLAEEGAAFVGPSLLQAEFQDLALRSSGLDPLTAQLILASVKGQLDLADKASVRRGRGADSD